ncbi:MAG TPA: hypothetical protein VNX47_12105 [Nevskia sp.]|nr:hypothetical protein [Nevskia sp.]
MNRNIRIAAAAAALCSTAAQAIPEGPAYPSAAWVQRETQNYASVSQAPTEELANPVFLQRLTTQSLTNITSLTTRDLADPSWVLASSTPLDQLLAALQNPTALSTSLQQILQQAAANPAGAVSLSLNSPLTPLCTSYAFQCDGNPFSFPESTGPDGSSFYATEALVTPVLFYDSGCARLNGQVWQPRNLPAGTTLPGVVIQNGSVEAPQTAYWWAAQLLVRNGYVVLTFDPRGQGRSDQETPSGQQGTNINSSVFWTGLVDAIDFFRSTPGTPYPNNAPCAAAYPTAMTAYNPAHAAIDPDRLGIAGHSLGAIGVSIVQGYGAPGADPWPGKLDKANPVKVAVAWDGLLAPGSFTIGGAAGGGVLTLLETLPVTKQAYDYIEQNIIDGKQPKFAPRVPSMGQSSEYGLVPTPYLMPPDPEGHKDGFSAWKAAGVPVFEFTIQGSSHYEWSLVPTFPTSSWCPDTSSGTCAGGYGQPMAQHYSLAWLDRWLKKSGEPGYADADARLLDDGGAQGKTKMSFYFRSARDFAARDGTTHSCDDIRAGCGDAAGSSSSGGVSSSSSGGSSTGSGGGAFGPELLAALAAFAARRRRRQT